MANGVFNVSKGEVAENVTSNAALFGILLLKTVESDALMQDRVTLTDLLAGSTEANFTNYARKTGLTATRTVDQTNDWCTVSVPNQTWTAAGGGLNNTLAKLVVFYEDAAADGTRIPCTHHDFVVTTDGTDLIASFSTTFYKAA